MLPIIDPILKLADTILNKFVTSDKERGELRNEFNKLVITQIDQLLTYQKDIINNEAKGSKLQRNWRPILMLSFGFIVIYTYFFQPAFGNLIGLSPVTLDPKFWDLLSLGIGGYVVGRSVEKIADTVSKNFKVK